MPCSFCSASRLLQAPSETVQTPYSPVESSARSLSHLLEESFALFHLWFKPHAFACRAIILIHAWLVGLICLSLQWGARGYRIRQSRGVHTVYRTLGEKLSYFPAERYLRGIGVLGYALWGLDVTRCLCSSYRCTVPSRCRASWSVYNRKILCASNSWVSVALKKGFCQSYHGQVPHCWFSQRSS